MHDRDPPPPDIVAARQAFFLDGRLPAERLPAHIGPSWLRSRGQGADLAGPVPVGRSALALRRERSLHLIENAQPELEALSEQMAHTRSVVILTDADGLILEETGSTDFLRRAERVALQPGADWSEERCGTNAIGTALVMRQALEVRGGEHFLDEHRILSCAAAPVLSARGEVLGVLDVSGDASQLHLHALALVRLAGEQIEHRLVHAAARGRRVLRFHARAPMIGTPREALLVVEDDRVAGANAIALRALGLDWADVLDRPLDRLFESRWRLLGADRGELRTHRGQVFGSELHAGPQARAAASSTPAGRAAPARPRGGTAAAPSPYDDDTTLAPLLAQAVRVLDAGSAVLLQGETGAGKDVFATLLHRRSARADGPFVALNCAALPESLVEAELFGYAEGAFTGAQRRGQTGRIREADGGVLFLDEIGDMPLLLQSRLLRVLQERAVTPLGGGRSTPVDFALVCATHRDLQAMVEAGSFRADLFYRLQDYTVALPALRERGDIPQVIERVFAQTGAASTGVRLAPETVAALAARPWPGNLRQLTSTLRTLVALAAPGEVIGPGRLPPCAAARAAGAGAGIGVAAATTPALRAPGQAPATVAPGTVPMAVTGSSPAPALPSAPPLPLRHLAAEAIERALQASEGRVGPAARALGVNRSTVYRHLAQKEKAR